MQNKKSLLASSIIILWLAFLFLPLFCHAAEQDVVITEIGAYETSANEWLEIFNNGPEAVDLTNWKFYEAATNHRLTASQNDFILGPGEYAIIANVADNFKQVHPNFTGTIFDSSWSSLNEAGEEIGLKNANGETIELFTYLSCPDTSLQRIKPGLIDYTATNWQIHATGNSAGRANEYSAEPNPEPDPDPLPDPDPQPDPDPDLDPEPEPEPETTVVTEQRIISGSILINELVSDATTEWIELYNRNAINIDLTGWKIFDGAETATVLEGEIGISSENPFFIIEAPKGKLNNSGDAVILKDKSGNIIDAVFYGDWENDAKENNAPTPKKDQSLARKIDGGNTNNNKADFSLTDTPTKNAPNLITLPPEDTTSNEEPQTTSKTTKLNTKPKIIFNEIYPNPVGSDLNDEFIELKNIGETTVDLNNWQIQDNSPRIYTVSKQDFPNTEIKPNELFLLSRKITGLALDNDKDNLKLISADNKTIATAKYSQDGDPTENLSYSFSKKELWVWSTAISPNSDNQIIPLNQMPIINLSCPSNIGYKEKLVCDASDSYDLENDPLTFTWNILDQSIPGPILEFPILSEEATLEIELLVSDGKNISKQNEKIKINNLPKKDKKVSTATTTKTTGSKSATAKTPAGLVNADLNVAKTLPIGTKIQTKGVVSVLPNIFGKTIMYVAGSGMQLYMAKADWPTLEVGDLVLITGTLAETQNEKRIRLSSGEDLLVLGKDETPQPRLLNIEDINPDLVGYLIEVNGQLIEKNGLNFYLQDETGEANIYIKKNTQIDKSKFVEGDQLKISGILSRNNEAYKILPRSPEDIVKIIPEPTSQPATQVAPNQNNNSILKYLIASATFLTLCLIGLWGFRRKRRLK